MRFVRALAALLFLSMPFQASAAGFNNTSGTISYFIIGSNGDFYVRVSDGVPTACTKSSSYIKIPHSNTTAISMVLMLITTKRSADFYIDHNDPDVATNCNLNMIQGS